MMYPFLSASSARGGRMQSHVIVISKPISEGRVCSTAEPIEKHGLLRSTFLGVLLPMDFV